MINQSKGSNLTVMEENPDEKWIKIYREREREREREIDFTSDHDSACKGIVRERCFELQRVAVVSSKTR